MNEHKCALKPVSIGVDVHFVILNLIFLKMKTKGGSMVYAYVGIIPSPGVAHEHAKIIPRVKKLPLNVLTGTITGTLILK